MDYSQKQGGKGFLLSLKNLFSLLKRLQSAFYIFRYIVLTPKALGAELTRAVSSGNAELVEHLLNLDVAPNGTAGSSENQFMPIMAATALGDTNMVSLLVEKGAEVNVKNASHTTPLMFAAMNGHTEAVRLLLSYGAEVNTVNQMGRTAAMFAAADGSTQILELLVAHHADLSIQDQWGDTATSLFKQYQEETATLLELTKTLMFSPASEKSNVLPFRKPTSKQKN
jgi:ankyrin repeat protein